MSPKNAYPKGYKLGPDNQSWLMRQKNKIQVWFTGGPRVPKGFWKWREIPHTLVALKGNGYWRLENTDGTDQMPHLLSFIWNGTLSRHYLSRIQPWTRWHIALMFPLAIHFSVIYRSKDVIEYPKYQSDFGWKKGIMGYLGWVRDSDKIYKPKVYAGGNFE